MNNPELRRNLAEHMANIEETIGQHYKIYGDKFKEHKCFWDTLASEEANHARCIRDLYSKVEEGLISLNEKRFNKESIVELGRQLKEMLAYIREHGISIKKALEDSLKIEKIVLEKNFFEAFETESPEFKGVLERIVEDTKSHRMKIEQLLEKYP